MTIINKLDKLGYKTIPQDFYNKIEAWRSWYNGNVDKFHDYTVFTGQSRVKCRRYTLNMAKKVSEDWANLLMNEKVKITLEGEEEQTFFNEVCRRNHFETRCNEMQELKSALGTTAYVVRVSGMTIDPDTGEVTDGIDGEVKIDYVTADHIYPLAWDNREVLDCAFASELFHDGKPYVYLQVHKRAENGEYDIENYLYDNTNGSMKEASLSDIPATANVPEVIHTGSTQRMFVLDRLNIVNNVDITSPMGVAVYANAIDQLKGCDIAYDSYVNEFVLGKKRVMIKPGATKTLDGESVFDPNDVAFYVLPEDTGDGNLIEPIDMTLRTTDHNTGIQDMLNVLSARCGFGENHYRFDGGSVATATQIVSENSTMFRTIKKHEIILEQVLTELCRIILHVGNTMLRQPLNEDVEISIDFDDSIIEDKASDFSRDMQLLNAGILNDWEFRMKWLNEDEATARAALPKMQDMADEGQEDIE